MLFSSRSPASSSTSVRRLLVGATCNVVESLETRRLLCDPSTTAGLAPEFSSAIERHIDATRATSSASGSSDAAASIVWTNRGSTANDSDKFNQVFGTTVDSATGLTKADEARKVIDQVFADWMKVIPSFNRADGTTTLQLTVTMNTALNNNNAAAGPATTAPSDGMPRTGAVSINAGTDGHGAGYYIDTQPGDYTEFGGIIQNAFSAFPSGSFGADLYSLVSLEVTHALGIIGPGTANPTFYTGYKFVTSGLISKSSTADNFEGVGTGVLGVFNGPSIQHLLTTNNGGASSNGGIDWGSLIHTAGASGRLVVQSGDARYQPITLGSTTYYPDDDTGNAIYETPRLLPNEVVLDMLHDAYGYTIQDPHTIPNFYSALSLTSHTLFISGPIGSTIANDFRNTSNDVITVDQSGSTITVSVNVGNDTPASGNLPGAGDLAAYVSTFDASQVNAIQIDGQAGSDTIVIRSVKPTTINGGDGDDNIRIHGVVGTANSVSVNGGNGNDSISIGTSDDRLDDLSGYVTVAGGAGTDTIRFDDAGSPYGDTYNIFGTYFTRTNTNNSQVSFNSLENLYVDSGNGDSEFDVDAIPSGMTYEVNAGGGVDTVSVGNHDVSGINGTLNVHGGGNGDRIILDDANTNAGHTYTVNGSTLQRTDRPNYLAFDGFSSIYAYGGSAADTFNVTPSSSASFFVNGNSPGVAPGDTLNLALAGVTGATNTGSSWTFTNRNAVSYASIETFTSTGGNNAPAVSYLSGPTGTVAPNTSFGLTASGVSDADGNLTGVHFYRETNGTNGLQIGSDLLESTVNVGSGGSYSTTLSTSGFSAGVYTYYAVAYDAAAAISSPVSTSITVGITNGAPTIAGLTLSPSTVTQAQSYLASAVGASDPDNNLAGVYFYLESNGIAGLQNSDTYLAADTNGNDGYSYLGSGSSLVPGTYTLYAQAFDVVGATSAGAPATLTINSTVNHGPQMNGGLYAIPNPVSTNTTFAILAGTISDSDGTVTSVSFYRESNGIGGLQAGSDTLLGTDTVSNDGWFLSSIPTGSVAGTFTFYATASDSAGYTSQPSSISVPITGGTPANVVGSNLSYNTAPLTMNFTFDSDVGSSLDFSDVSIVNSATSAAVTIDSVGWNAGSKTASFTLHGVPADGNYNVTLHASGVTTTTGTAMASDYTTSFFMLGGDADHNRAVNFTDLLTLAKNYGKSGKTYADGDFDLSGTVNFSDLLILARNYGKTLAASPAAAELPVATADARRRPTEGVLS